MRRLGSLMAALLSPPVDAVLVVAAVSAGSSGAEASPLGIPSEDSKCGAVAVATPADVADDSACGGGELRAHPCGVVGLGTALEGVLGMAPLHYARHLYASQSLP